MRLLAALAFSFNLFTALSARGQLPAPAIQPMNELAATERAFAAKSVAEGMRAAFLEYFAPDGINFAAIVSEVDKHLADDAIVTTDAGNFGSYVHRYIGFKQTQTFLSSIVGAMGSGMPMAVAATLRKPGKQVVCFIGDGGTLMMGNELATACQYGGNPIMIISDNSMYGTIGMHSYVRYPDRKFMEIGRAHV